jgi:hypothetical protein
MALLLSRRITHSFHTNRRAAFGVFSALAGSGGGGARGSERPLLAAGSDPPRPLVGVRAHEPHKAGCEGRFVERLVLDRLGVISNSLKAIAPALWKDLREL